jgi:hypothetical protein
MNKTAIAALCLSLGAFGSAASAQECPPGSIVCASASVTIGTGPVYAQPVQPVYVQPVQPVYVQQPVYIQRPPRVIYTPAPPVRYYVTPRPTYYYVAPQSMYFWRSNVLVGGGISLGAAFFGGRVADQPGIVGLASAVGRVRAPGHIGGEIAIGAAFGRDWNGDNRFELPFWLSGLVYFNPQHRAQVYGVIGANGSVAGVSYSAANRAAGAHGGRRSGDYLYIGGHVGVGLEYQITQRFVLFADVRGFLRTRIDDEIRTNPEFAENLADGTTRTTNTSMGAITQFGAIFYY